MHIFGQTDDTGGRCADGQGAMTIRKLLGAAVFVLVLIGLAAESFCAAETVGGDLKSRLYADCIEYEGNMYRLKKRLTTVLFMGVDQWESEMDANKTYRNGSRADFQALVVFDDNAQTITVLPINRDLMAEITVVNFLGETIGTKVSQICMAYSYGDGEQGSCELLMESLSKRLNGIPIDSYMAMRLDGISTLNDALGGVQVTLDEDFSMYAPEMTVGRTLTLTGKQAEYYLRYRYEIGDGSNAARMLRQREYLEAAKQALMERTQEDGAEVLAIYDALEPHLVTDMPRGKVMNLANKVKPYSILPVVEIRGENVVGESGLYEFYPDEEALTQVILDVFYERIAG